MAHCDPKSKYPKYFKKIDLTVGPKAGVRTAVVLLVYYEGGKSMAKMSLIKEIKQCRKVPAYNDENIL